MYLRAPIRAGYKSALFFCLALAFGTAKAGSFQINPIRVNLSPAAPTAAVTVTNDGTEPVVVQTEAQSWSQSDNKDVYTATRDLIATPPIITIAPGAAQILRVGLMRALDTQRELAYRLFVREVPPPPQPGFKGLQVALRVGIPVFIPPIHGQARPQITWTGSIAANGMLTIIASNHGDAHIRISDLRIFIPGRSKPVADDALLTYVLAGDSREWRLHPRMQINAASRVRLQATTDTGNVDTQLDISSR